MLSHIDPSINEIGPSNKPLPWDARLARIRTTMELYETPKGAFALPWPNPSAFDNLPDSYAIDRGYCVELDIS